MITIMSEWWSGKERLVASWIVFMYELWVGRARTELKDLGEHLISRMSGTCVFSAVLPRTSASPFLHWMVLSAVFVCQKCLFFLWILPIFLVICKGINIVLHHNNLVMFCYVKMVWTLIATSIEGIGGTIFFGIVVMPLLLHSMIKAHPCHLFHKS